MMKSLLFATLCIVATCAIPHSKLSGKHQPGTGRIVNGIQAANGQFPHQAIVYGRGFCSGAIISPDYILTAASCISGISNVNNFGVYVGITDRFAEDSQEMLSVSQSTSHEKFDSKTLVNNIAVLKLSKPLVFNDLVQPIALSEIALEPSTPVTLSGWGQTSDDPDYISTDLHYAEMESLDKVICEYFFGEGTISDGVACANSKYPAESVCYGDYGGPVITNSTGSLTHVGIISFESEHGCESGYPSGFTRTNYYREWIRERTGI